MHPSLYAWRSGIEGIGTLTLPSYFTMFAVGFCLAVFLSWRWAGRAGLPRDTVLDLGIYMLVFGVLGARLLHVIADGELSNYINWCVDPRAVVWRVTEVECRGEGLRGIWDAAEGVCRPADPAARPIWERCTLWLQFWQGGLAFYGGFVAASLFGIHFIRREGLPLARVLDMTGWAIPFGLGWGRLGCFLNGCCYGAVVEADSETPFWAVAFPRWSPAWLDHLGQGLIRRSAECSLPVHPTQLYESAAAFAVAAIAYGYLEPRKRWNGEVFLTSCALYAIARFFIEFLRRDARGAVGPLSTSQIIGLGVIAVVAWAWPRLRRAAADGGRA